MEGQSGLICPFSPQKWQVKEKVYVCLVPFEFAVTFIDFIKAKKNKK